MSLKPRQIYDDYRDSEPACEIAAELGIELDRRGLPMFWPAGSVYIEAVDVHHLFSVSGQRLHLKSNLIALCRKWHDWFHSGNHADQVPVRLLCLAAKMHKAVRLQDPAEFDLRELKQASGCSIPGWIECASLEPAWAWVEPYRIELLERLA